MQNGTQEQMHPSGKLQAAVETAWFRHMITSLIIINAIILGVLTYSATLPAPTVRVLEGLDRTITLIFAVEIALKIIALRLGFFRSGWNWFDFIVVGISFVPGGSGFTVLRAMRVLRVLRLLHVVPTLRRITEALLKSLPGMGAILAVLALLTYVAAVMATNMFGNTTNPDVIELFGNLPSSAYSLFQVMTMDGWRFEVVQKVVDDGNPYAPFFFLIFIFVASFAVLNLFIALIVDALAAEQRAVTEEHLDEIEEEMEEEFEIADIERDQILLLLKELKAEIASLKTEKSKS